MSRGRSVRHRSRRRLAALAFLSNISLDGTYRDTRISGLTARRPTIVAKEEPTGAHEAVAPASAAVGAVGSQEATIVAAVSAPRTSSLRRQRSVDAGDMRHQRSTADGAGSHRQRCQTVGGEPGDSLLRRIVQAGHITSKIEDMLGHGASSSESVCGSVRSGRPCSSVSELSSAPMVRLARDRTAAMSHAYASAGAGDERLVLVAGGRLPMLVVSLFTAGRPGALRHGPPRRERQELRADMSVRRRYNSGSRAPLATIVDRADAFSMLGLEPLAEGQEVSFSQLLQPSTPQPGGRRQLSQERDSDAAHAHGRHAPAVSRCVSHDPQLHRRAVTAAADVGSVEHSAASLDRVLDGGGAAGGDGSAAAGYDPHLLDNPETRSESHRTVLTFRAYRASIIDYVKPADLKRIDNDRFRQRFPHVQLTLSKLRSLKREMRRAATDCRIDLLSVAQGHVYFEKLVLRGFITKANRKLVAGACLLLAAKMNDVKGDTMSQLVERTETLFRLHRRELFSCELGVLVALQFALHLQISELEPHLRRLQA